MYVWTVPDMKEGGRLRPLAECYFCTELMHLEECMLKYPGHGRIDQLKSAVFQVRLDFTDDVQMWGRLLKREFTKVNNDAMLKAKPDDLAGIVMRKLSSVESDCTTLRTVCIFEIYST